ncbi:hypothetical protein PG990_012973 [Apiospora arundinis]
MADPGSSDKSLLDRLNALKPTTVNLDKSETPVTATPSNQPLSKEDALSERLKSLRGQAATQSAHISGSADPGADIPSPAPQSSSSFGPSVAQPHPDQAELSTDLGRPDQISENASKGTVQGTQDMESLLDTDDQTLEELLADLGSDEQWLEDMATEYANDEHQRVSAMLEELGKPRAQDQRSSNSQHDETDDDESDGEPMAREADHVLAKAQDEVEWEKLNTPDSESAPVRASGTKKEPAPGSTAAGASNPDPFDLPKVPTDLQDPPEAPEIPQGDDFEAEIASRMAALKGLGGKDSSLPSVPSASIDDLGLPGVPTFSPEDRPVKGVYKRYGYTDEDQKSWCVVCLEDGAIRCIDCDDDIYCARCWKEMHVGLQAHYEDRGHRWEKYVKGG